MHSIVAMRLDDDMDQYLIYLNKILNIVHYLAFELFLVAMIRLALQISPVRIVNDNIVETLVPMA